MYALKLVLDEDIGSNRFLEQWSNVRCIAPQLSQYR